MTPAMAQRLADQLLRAVRVRALSPEPVPAEFAEKAVSLVLPPEPEPYPEEAPPHDPG